jgi:hypothetical protein
MSARVALVGYIVLSEGRPMKVWHAERWQVVWSAEFPEGVAA